MSLELWFTFVLASVALVVIPGPTVLLTVSYALTQGRRIALATAAGVALGDFLAMSASLAGLGALIATSATLFTVLKWVGAAYLVYLGIKLLRAPAMTVKIDEETAPIGAAAIFWHATAVTALNPKSIGFFIAFVPQFMRPEQPLMPQFVTLIITFVTIGAISAFSYAMLADHLRRYIRRPSVMRWMTRTGGGTLIGMGALTATLQRS